MKDPFKAKATLKTSSGEVTIFRLDALKALAPSGIDRLPFSIKILLENLLRNVDGFQVSEKDVRQLAGWNAKAPMQVELPFRPGRVVLQDFTGVPAVVDLAALRSAIKRLGGDPKKINPQVPCDLVIDHSVQVDAFASKEALAINTKREFERNRERYEFLRWGQKAFSNFRVVPPSTGIVHQVNLEYLSKCVLAKAEDGKLTVFPDTLVGTDSHTTMINGLGVLGWGVGGIEAEAVMLGQPIYMLTPEVIGFKLTGKLREGVTATDLVLTVTQILRKRGVVGKFIEFFGSGLDELSLADRATLANMAPEYGATMGFFPIDVETLRYLKRTGKTAEEVDLVERYMKEQGLFRTSATPDPLFTDMLELDLSSTEPSLAGPKRPQDRVSLSGLKEGFERSLTAPIAERGFGLDEKSLKTRVTLSDPKFGREITHGAVTIAAITSCTNTSNPTVMIGAGLLAKKAVERGLAQKPYVKTSLAPGSLVVTQYLKKAGLTPYLEKLGFYTVGYGCTTCIGNSGPLPEPVARAVAEGKLIAASVLSGNRNFEGRINPHVKANYLASPPLVVAYAIAGTVDIDLSKEPLGKDAKGEAVYLKDIWPSQKEVQDAVETCVNPELFKSSYADVFKGSAEWAAIPETKSELYDWKKDSTYIQEPPFFLGLKREAGSIQPIRGARVLVSVGDSVTTDHISPAGNIANDSPAGTYLLEQGVPKDDFNSYGARRGNDRVMTRGTFANIRLHNLLIPGKEGCWTRILPEGRETSIYEASVHYKKAGTPLLILAGKEYGSGSSRDWAAKGPYLLGIRFVIAESYERIHRSNLVGMGILPLEFKKGETRASLGLTGEEAFDIEGLTDDLKPLQTLTVTAHLAGGKKSFQTTVRIDTAVEIEYYRNGGILQTVLRNILKN